jgi:dienelactone hydrolase
LLAAVGFGVYVSFALRPGLGPWRDAGVLVAVAIAVLLLSRWLFQLAQWLIGKIPGRMVGMLIGGAVLLMLTGLTPLPAVIVSALVALFGGMLLSFWVGREGRGRRILVRSLLLLATGALGVLVWLFWMPGFNGDPADAPLSKQPKIDSPALADPGTTGPFKVVSLTYGAGSDRHRTEFAGLATLKSRTVDGSKLLKDKEGWRGKVRSWYWGFDTSKMPLNARVWMPEGPGPFPLILIVHGNHLDTDYSDPGYAYLGELLASRGFILASIDENFLNFNWSGDYETAEQPARGWLLLEHLKLWREWARTKGHRLEGKADLEHVVLMGHSRGGEAAATATTFNRMDYFPGDGRQKFDYGFGIRGIVAIAPSDGQYRPAGMPRRLENVNYFVVQGGWDADVSAFMGSRQYTAVSFTPEFDGFKAELWIYRANHGQFNTSWGRFDNGGPGGWMLNVKPLLSGDEQRKIAGAYFSAFAEAVLHE